MPDQDGDGPWWAGRADYWKRTLAAASITFAVLPSVVFALRVYATHKIKKSKTMAEELLMGLAVVFMWAETAAVLLKCYNGVGVPQDELPEDQFVRLNQGSWLVAKFCVLSLLCSRVSIILFLKRVFDTHDLIRWLLWGLAIYNIVWAIISLFMSIFSCKPVSYYWDKSTEGGSCIDTDIYNNESLAMSVLGLASDLAMFTIPLPTVWRLQLKTKQKAAATAVLCVGGIVCIFSLLRCVQFAYFDTAHLSTSGNLETLWTLLETDLSITCGCMPQLRPLLSRVLGDSTAQSNSVTYSPSNPFHRGYGPNSNLTKGGGIHTTVSSGPSHRVRLGNEEARDSDEIELRGIEVQTTVNHESSMKPTKEMVNDRDDSSANLSG